MSGSNVRANQLTSEHDIVRRVLVALIREVSTRPRDFRSLLVIIGLNRILANHSVSKASGVLKTNWVAGYNVVTGERR